MDASALDTHPEVAEKVGREILESKLDPAAWAAALSKSAGNREQALSLYASIRMKSLTGQHRVHLAKVDSFESRRLTKCLGDQNERASIALSFREMIDGPNPGIEPDFAKPKLSPLWMTILWVGTTGTVATLGQLFSADLSETLVRCLSVISMVCGLAVVGAALILHRILPKHWILQGWSTGMVAACNLLCLSSLALGTKVITRSMAEESGTAPIHQVSDPQTRPAKVKTVIIRNPYMVSTQTGGSSLEN